MNPAQDAARRKLIEQHEAKKVLSVIAMPRMVIRGQDGIERILWAHPDDPAPTNYWLTNLDGKDPIYQEPS